MYKIVLRFLILYVYIVSMAVGCGTGIGNPSTSGASPLNENSSASPQDKSPPSQSTIDSIKAEYDADLSAQLTGGQDCGAYAEIDSELEIETGRECIRLAFSACKPARYFISSKTSGGIFVSYVAVRPIESRCSIYAHTASSRLTLYEGEIAQSCDSLGSNVIPELACVANK